MKTTLSPVRKKSHHTTFRFCSTVCGRATYRMQDENRGPGRSLHRAFVWPAQARANTATGMAAYQRGDYATALREFSAAADQESSLDWYLKAANQGLAPAEFEVALSYENGTGVAQDDQIAMQWLRKAANQGFASAQYELAVHFFIGRAGSMSKTEAMAWLAKAADQDHPQAMRNLAIIYLTGQDVAADPKKAMALLHRGAGDGYAIFFNYLGKIYEQGDAVERDPVVAYAMYSIAVARGDQQAAAEQQKIGMQLDSSQRAHAIKLSDHWASGKPLPDADVH